MKLALKIVGGLIALIIIAAIAIPMLVSAEYIKAQLVEQVKKATGRELQIKGEAKITVFPNIAIEVEDVTLGNPGGFTSPYLVHIDKLATGAALKPLLSKELRITGITLEGAKLHLEQLKSGVKNWDFANAAAPKEPTAEPVGGAKKSPLNQFAIGRVTIKDTSVNMIKPDAKPMLIDGINIALDGADGSGQLSLNGSVNYQNQPVKFKVGIDEMKALLAGKTEPVIASLNLPSGNLNFDGKMAIGDAPNADGTLKFTSDDLGQLMAWATGKKPAGNLPKKVNIKTQLGFKGMQYISLGDLSFTVDSLTGAGKLLLNMAGAVPSINGELKLGDVNIEALTGKSGSSAAGNASATAASSGGEGWSTAPLDLSGLRAVNANLKITTPKVTTGKLQLTNIDSTIKMDNGTLNLALANLSLYGGAAKGTVTLDGSSAAAGLGTNLTLSKVDIENLMTALSGASKIKGIATVSVNVNGRGTSQKALIGSLNGNGTMKINDGAIKGINVASFLRDAKKGFILGDSSTQSTDFTELTASYKIAQGIVSNDDLSMKSPVLRLAGSGTINLPARTINYRAVPTLVSSLKGQGGEAATGLDIPLIITGPWSAISITPDVSGMLTNALKDPAALKENLKGIKDSIGDFNSPKDIGKALLGGKKEVPATTTPATGSTTPSTAAPATTAAPVDKKAEKQQKINDAIGGVLGAFGK
ncbi:MAG: AsmA family protein [Rickettsiales bacterium]